MATRSSDDPIRGGAITLPGKAKLMSPGHVNPPYTVLEPLEPRLLLSASTPFELATLPAEHGGDGSKGFVVTDPHDQIETISGAGDFNGDGYDDLIVGMPYYSELGKVSVIYGGPDGFGGTINQAEMNWRDGFTLYGYYNAFLGSSVSSAGDINGDGFDDVIIGAKGGHWWSTVFDEEWGNNGTAYVIFGKAGGLGKNSDIPGWYGLRNLNGENGFTLDHTDHHSYVYDVSGAGDINGDGLDDLVVATNADSYVVFGKKAGFQERVKFDDLDGTNGFAIKATLSRYNINSVSVIGDLNGDGYDDIVLGSSYGNERYLVFGRRSGYANGIDLSTLNGKNGFILIGTEDGGRVSHAGDVNSDGFDDLLIGTQHIHEGDGKYTNTNYVVFGKRRGFEPVFDMDSLDGTNGFVVQGLTSDDRWHLAVSGAGDVNGDGFDDLLLGASKAEFHGNVDAGGAYLLFGRASGYAANLEYSDIEGANGFAIHGPEPYARVGISVAGVGDVNGDGFDDIGIGSDGASSRAPHEAYVIFGGRFIDDGLDAGTDEPDLLVGTEGGDVLMGYQGDDVLIGHGGADALRGGVGDDVIAISDLAFLSVDGGRGHDTLRLDGSELYLPLDGSVAERIRNIEVIDLTGSGSNSLILDRVSVYDTVTDPRDTLIIKGDNDDTIYMGSDWARTSRSEVIDSEVFRIFNLGYVVLKVADSIQLLNAPPAATPGDLTGDGMADILWRSTRDGHNTLWQMNTTTLGLESRIKQLNNTDWKLVGTGDFTGDGQNDILWRNTSDGRNRVWEMDGADFVQRIDLKTLVSQKWQVVGVGDMTGDGWNEIVWRNTHNGRNVAWQMFGPQFVDQIELKRLASRNWQAAGVGDLTGDGKNDILWHNRSDGRNTVWKMSGTDFVKSKRIKKLRDTNWQIAGIADYTGDGAADLLWRHTQRGANAVWSMQGTTFQFGVPLPSLDDPLLQPASPLLGLWEY